MTLQKWIDSVAARHAAVVAGTTDRPIILVAFRVQLLAGVPKHTSFIEASVRSVCQSKKAHAKIVSFLLPWAAKKSKKFSAAD
jgi:hypothetical protein